jgi:RNA polymerase sigma-70 factor (sigma-E family)
MSRALAECEAIGVSARPAVSARRDDDFTAYVQARLAWLRRVAYLLCQDWQRADDLVQTAVTSLYVHWRRARTMESIDGYARTILVRAFLSERRGGWARRVTLMTQLPDAPEPVPDAADALDVRAALAGLPPRQRATLVLRFYCDLNVDQSARVLGCSAGTVKSQTAKALAGLRRSLGEPAGREGTEGAPGPQGAAAVWEGRPGHG